MRRRVKGILTTGKQFSLDSRIDLVNSGIQAPTSSVRPLSDCIRENLDLMREESFETEGHL